MRIVSGKKRIVDGEFELNWSATALRRLYVDRHSSLQLVSIIWGVGKTYAKP